MRPPAADWLIELGIGSGRAPVYVHVGGCHMAKNRTKSITEEQARGTFPPPRESPTTATAPVRWVTSWRAA
ncbi:DUF6233 domain-containing protein [Streptomyces sp. NBC_00120]|nr:DUF6233 domain-containing protein [Streptomyces sp. NBC_00120]MCX5321531.1 DUF6233 domain-containing protein [Streptomyces sp. NBC_00120]